MRRSDQLVDRRIARLRGTDPDAAAALALRHRGVCPCCGGRAEVSTEDAPSGLRHCRCLDCRWAASTTEERWRMAPQVGLRQLCADAAMSGRLASELRQKQTVADMDARAYTIPDRAHRRKARVEEKTADAAD